MSQPSTSNLYLTYCTLLFGATARCGPRIHSQWASNHLYFSFSFHLLTFNILKYPSMYCCHLLLSLPLFFTPIVSLFITLFQILSLLIFSAWPILLNLENFINPTIYITLYFKYMTNIVFT